MRKYLHGAAAAVRRLRRLVRSAASYSRWKRAGIPLAALAVGCSQAGTGTGMAWRELFAEDGGWVLSVSADAERVLAAGGAPSTTAGQPGRGTLTIARDQGLTIKRIPSPRPGVLWWVDARTSHVAWLAGENGTVLRATLPRPGEGEPEVRAIPTDTTATLYGIVALSDDDVWAVGGADGQPGVLLHGSAAAGLSTDRSVPAVGTLFKISGGSADTLYAVGASGVLLRRTAGGWTRDPSPTTDRVFTVVDWGDRALAVGGLSAGRALRFGGGAWSMLALPEDPPVPALAGVAAQGDAVFLVGQRGTILSQADGARPAASAPLVTEESGTTLDLHGAAAAGCTRYAAGGNLSQFRLRPPVGTVLVSDAACPR